MPAIRNRNLGYNPNCIWPTYVARKKFNVYVPKGILKSVFFLGIKKDGRFLPRATAFLASRQIEGYWFIHVVTAEHVVAQLLAKGHDIYARINMKDGGVLEQRISHDAWYFHPDEKHDTDVAVAAFNATPDMDISATPLEEEFIASDKLMDEHQIGVGDEVAIIGLFRSHYGLEKNSPIVRIGNIAALQGEPIKSQHGFIEGHLVEARSIGGLSGSPVWLSLQQTRKFVGVKKEIVQRPYYLFGLMHGHFDIKDLNYDVVTDAETDAIGTINSGIGVVIPVRKIVETTDHPELVEQRNELVEKFKAEGATPDAVGDDLPANDENPTHQEDFRRLVGAAARKPEPKD